MDNGSSFAVYCFYSQVYYEAFVEKKIMTDMIPSLDIYFDNFNEPIIYR